MAVRTEREQARAYRRITALLGSLSEWEGADTLEAIAYEIDSAQRALGQPLVSTSDEGSIRYWRKRADSFGIEHDGPEADDQEEDA